MFNISQQNKRFKLNVFVYFAASLAATGLVWTRYSMVIIPKNYPLFSVNFFVALTNVGQLIRIAFTGKASETEETLKPTAIETVPINAAN